MSEAVPLPDGPLIDEQQAVVAQLTAVELEEIDQALLSNAKVRWRKVAMIVGLTMGQLSERNIRVPGIPDAFYAIRVRKLVCERRLEAEGNLAYMGFSEVRLPQSQA